MDTKIVVDVTKVSLNGTLDIRFTKLNTVDGSRQYHRTTLPPGVSWATQMAAVGRHLERLGWPEVAGEDISSVQTIADRVHTPAVITEYRRQKLRADTLVRG